MPPRYRRTAYARRAPARRRLEWATSNITDNAKGPNLPFPHDLLAGFVAAGGSREGLTIMRVHAQFAFAPAAAGDSCIFGLIVDSTVAPATAGGLLDPVQSPYEPWMLNRCYFPPSSGATVDASSGFEIDIRAKRKVQHVQETLWFSWVARTSTTVSLGMYFRVLVALP